VSVGYETLEYELADGVATVTLNRPAALNSFNPAMCTDFAALWARVRVDEDVRCVVLRAAGDHFSTGLDVKAGRGEQPHSPWLADDPGEQLSPKRNRVWKPVVCAVQGMCAGGAFYWINEADLIICSADATFFDPHCTYGMTATLEPIGLRYRMPLGDVLRMVLLGLDERMSAETAQRVGLVSEVVVRERLWTRAGELAALIAAKPAWSVQGSIKSIWESMDLPRSTALERGMTYPQLTKLAQGPAQRAGRKPESWSLR
jgi:enoyl-CoA hydratase/carnithine racemase